MFKQVYNIYQGLGNDSNPTQKKGNIMNTSNAANQLLALDLDNSNDTDDLFPILGADSRNINQKITELLENLDEEMVKKIAVKFSGKGVYNFYDYEDRLCDLMGEDDYFDWADNNNVQ